MHAAGCITLAQQQHVQRHVPNGSHYMTRYKSHKSQPSGLGYLRSNDAVAAVKVWRVHVHRATLAFGDTPFTTYTLDTQISKSTLRNVHLNK